MKRLHHTTCTRCVNGDDKVFAKITTALPIAIAQIIKGVIFSNGQSSDEIIPITPFGSQMVNT